jgi:hypothetical protein
VVKIKFADSAKPNGYFIGTLIRKLMRRRIVCISDSDYGVFVPLLHQIAGAPCLGLFIYNKGGQRRDVMGIRTIASVLLCVYICVEVGSGQVRRLMRTFGLLEANAWAFCCRDPP